MKVVLQRVSEASVDVVNELGTLDPTFEPQQIGPGFMILVGVTDEDGDKPGVQDGINKPVDGETDADGENDPSIGEEPNVNDPTGGETTDPGTTTPVTPTVDASALSVKTNVGTTLPKDVTGNFDCTIKASESIRLSVSGTDAAVAWAVADASVLSISADGTISPIKAGITTVTATVGGAVLTITVRIK